MPTRKDLPKPIDDLRKARRWPKGVPMPKPGAYKSHQPWSYEDEEQLRRFYLKYGPQYVARLLGRSINAVKIHAGRIDAGGLVRKWTARELALLKKQYGKMPLEELAERLGRSSSSVRDKAWLSGLTDAPPLWSAQEIEQLQAQYKKVPAKEIARRLGRPYSSLVAKARQLGLSRTVRPLTAAVQRTIMKKMGRVPIEQIAAEVGMSRLRVVEIARANGYKGGQWWQKQWTAREDAFLKKQYAKMSIAEVARRLGCSSGMVTRRAETLGLPKKGVYGVRGARWTQRDDALLAKLYRTASDEDLAERLKQTVPGVRRRLAHLGLRRADGRTAARGWTVHDDALLSELCASHSREEIARRLGRSVDAIRHRAERRGLTLLRMTHEPWRTDEDALLRRSWKRSSTKELAVRLGRSVPAILKRLSSLGITISMRRPAQPKPWRPEDDRLLAELFGTMPRKDVAERLDRTMHSVAMRAARLGLTARKDG